jgi:hypothetical protein
MPSDPSYESDMILLRRGWAVICVSNEPLLPMGNRSSPASSRVAASLQLCHYFLLFLALLCGAATYRRRGGSAARSTNAAGTVNWSSLWQRSSNICSSWSRTLSGEEPNPGHRTAFPRAAWGVGPGETARNDAIGAAFCEAPWRLLSLAWAALPSLLERETPHRTDRCLSTGPFPMFKSNNRRNSGFLP